ncbi:hypothetical protein [Natrialba sp. SSL1]|uniref:hypothetical protein n=1 Tax=Natrialba sp. SSL1 TaxID=1869245 RepID=UPI0008F8F612|nr:hypothetical protein [Natrialba sp. SSL1]OIB58562.1 hypothetical protein BBD46_09625 [Natrialba sp. SSL1]
MSSPPRRSADLGRGIDRLATGCKRYGPGRLPNADRRDIGAGYAGASAALAISILFALSMLALAQLGSPFGVGHPFWALSAIAALPIVVPAAFLVGVLVWRTLSTMSPTTIPYFGAVAGLVATILTYLVSIVIVFILAVGLHATGGSDAVLWDAATLTALIAIVAATFTAWFTLPLGCLSGAIYERARTRSVPDAPATGAGSD